MVIAEDKVSSHQLVRTAPYNRFCGHYLRRPRLNRPIQGQMLPACQALNSALSEFLASLNEAVPL